ncbi:E3 ubiquitin-protein ligase NEURL3-like, partial [Poecilia reticulata]|uniref:E3 ubiquitin-protein ligase NEURL3-like n=1 Tax=Poecilia reticulata TaxID=8081 RepID=UPI0007EC168B
CLGPLTFHPRALGDMICLSEGGRRAERIEDTFYGGVVFTRRPVRTYERIRVLVERHVPHWQGTMRVGFTNVRPSARSLPLPQFSMPDLTQTSGHWATPVPESYCQEGSVLEFWVTDDDHICLKFQNFKKKKVEAEVDVSKPLWAMIDVYGQTCSVFLLGSKTKGFLSKKRSCPLPEPPIRRPSTFSHENTTLSKNFDDCISCLNMEIPADDHCVVCMVRQKDITLPCGHRCLCNHCTPKILAQFGTCPLCRLEISSPTATWTSLLQAQRQRIFFSKEHLVLYLTLSPHSPAVSNPTQREKSNDCISCRGMEIPADDRCVVCMTREAGIMLPCGHHCLCLICTSRVLVQFGTCPLCRVRIDTGVTFEDTMISRTGDS